LSSIAREFPEGIVLCDPGLIAGTDHVEAVLLQTTEYWKRNERLVRNGSLEILMRITCKRQISEAIAASKLVETDAVAILGLVSSAKEIKKSFAQLSALCKNLTLDNSLLILTREKSMKLKQFHGLPTSLSLVKLQTALREKSLLLNFSK
jgi:tRNA threonylcarbamoyladenosine modification (KEOPS) complex Cgi121 subunit